MHHTHTATRDQPYNASPRRYRAVKTPRSPNTLLFRIHSYRTHITHMLAMPDRSCYTGLCVPGTTHLKDVHASQATQSAPATYNRFIITYTDEAKNAASTDATADQIDWSAAAGTEQATWSDALYAGITSDVQSIDELLNIKTSYVRSTALDASVVTTSAALTPAQAQ